MQGDERERNTLDLYCYFDDPGAVHALIEWATTAGVMISPARKPWRRRGGSGALLATVQARAIGSPTPCRDQELLIKVCSRGSPALEPLHHDQAWTDSPLFGERHLFRQAFPPFPVRDGRVLMFMETKAGLDRFRTLGEIWDRDLPAGAQAVTHLLLGEWNSEKRIEATSAAKYVAIELRHAMSPGRSAYRWAKCHGLLQNFDWINASFGNDTVILPNPVRLSRAESLLQGATINFLVGRSHGDLHLDNVVVDYSHGSGMDVDRIRLIDLSAFELGAPLSRDIVALILSAIAPVARCGLSTIGADALSRLAVEPKPPSSQILPSTLIQTVTSIRAEATRRVPLQYRPVWRRQYLLSLVAQSIVYTSYENIGLDGHWLYLLIAARAAREALPPSASTQNPELAKRLTIPTRETSGE